MGILETVGKVAGIGGIALGVLLILFRNVLRKEVFPTLTRDQAFKLIRLLLILVWSIALVGITAWLVAPMIGPPKISPNPEANGSREPELDVERVPQSTQVKVKWINFPLSQQYKLHLMKCDRNRCYYEVPISISSGIRNVSLDDRITMVEIVRTQPEMDIRSYTHNGIELSDPRISDIVKQRQITRQ